MRHNDGGLVNLKLSGFWRQNIFPGKYTGCVYWAQCIVIAKTLCEFYCEKCTNKILLLVFIKDILSRNFRTVTNIWIYRYLVGSFVYTTFSYRVSQGYQDQTPISITLQIIKYPHMHNTLLWIVTYGYLEIDINS